MLQDLIRLLRRSDWFVSRRIASQNMFLGNASEEVSVDSEVASEQQYPTFPPPPPLDILARREDYRAKYLRPRRFAAPKGQKTDEPVYALYRLYEWFLLDVVTRYRDELEYFWRHSSWRVEDIPDPADDDPARYVFLACVTSLLVDSFNAKIKYGASRQAPAIMTMEYVEALKAIPMDARLWEKIPEWAEKVPPLGTILSIPTLEGEYLTGLEDPRANAFCKQRNILIWTPHIHFT